MAIRSVVEGMVIESLGICDSIFRAARSTALAPQKEVLSLLPGSQSCPADILLPNWEQGKPAAMDVTVISYLQSLTLQGGASSANHALFVGEHTKVSAHSPACCAVAVSLLPLAFEALDNCVYTPPPYNARLRYYGS